MKTTLASLSRAYLTALRKHLQSELTESAAPARRLGMRAVKMGLETLDMARIHEEALIAQVLPHLSARTSDGMIRRAGAFFAEAITPIEETHRGAREANVELQAAISSLTRRTEELAVSNQELKSEIARRKEGEESLRTSENTTSRLLGESRRMQEELRLLSRRLLSVQEEERKRISRELHDVIGQTLTGINLRLAALNAQSNANASELHKKIAITQRLVEKSVAIVHRFARDLRPAVLDDLGLIPALHSYIKGLAEQTGMRVDFTSFPGVEKQDSAVRTMLYRVVQESLSNVVRHAKASRAKVRIVSLNGGLCMMIKDNGQGFKIEEAMLAKGRKRLGLLGMRERVEMFGGTFQVESSPGKATTIRVEIPQKTISAKSRPANKTRRKTHPST